MRSLMVFHTGGVTGPEHSMLPVVNWLQSKGTVAFVVPERGAIGDDYSAVGAVSVLDFSALTYPRGLRERVRLARKLRDEVRMFRGELRRRRPDLVIAVTTVLPALLVAARLERIPTFVYAAEIFHQPWKAGPLRRVWGVLLARFTALASSGIVCCSHTVARQFPRWTRARVSVAYSAVGPEYGHGSRERGRSRWDLEPDVTCLVTVGSISRGRGQDVALRALALIRRHLPAVRLVVVGVPHPRAVDEEFDRELRALAESLDLADSVIFAGEVGSGANTEPIADLYAAADVVINSARFEEPYGRVGPEALVAGRPVVASRVGGIPEVLREGVDALLVPPDDPHALAAAVTRLLDDPALGQSLVTSGRRRVLETFGPEQALEAWKLALAPVIRRSEGEPL